MRRRDLLALPFLAGGRTPNFVFVLVDDLRFDELGCTGHPFAQTPNCDRLAQEGANFVNAFATTPLCSPSRASFLTGYYAHAHGITDNVARDALSHKLVTWPRLLHDAGYSTAFIGKWHMGNDDSPRPGFDRWVSFRGQGECIDPALNVDGVPTRSSGYVTDILTDYAIEFLDQRRNKPFCLYVAHKAIHPNVQQASDGSINPAQIDDADTFIAAPRHRDLYRGSTLPRRPNYGKVADGQPALKQTVERGLGMTSDATILNRARMMKAVDESLGRMLASLEKHGHLANTVVIFTSDHGYFYGEHGLGPERRLAYEEAIRIPLLVRYPSLFKAGSRPAKFVLSIDVAATALALGGVRTAKPLHGQPLYGGTTRDAVLVEYFSDTVFPNVRKMGYQAIRTNRWKYIHYTELQNSDEVYDLQDDPFEMNNVIADRKTPLAALRRRLNQLNER